MKKIISLLLVLCIVSGFAYADGSKIFYYDTVENKSINLPKSKWNSVSGGTLIREAESLEHSKDAELFEDSTASGGFSLRAVGPSFASDPNSISEPTISFIADIPSDEAGFYSLWVRVKCTDASNHSYYEMCSVSSAEYAGRWFDHNSDYVWVKVFSGKVGEGTFGYFIKYRDNGFKVDKFILTSNSSFVPAGIDDVPQSSSGETNLYALPPITPPENVHPRVLVTKDMIPKLKENAQNPVLKTIYDQVKERAFNEMNFSLPSKGSASNFSMSHLFTLQCRAYMYLMGEVDAEHAKDTVKYMRQVYDTLSWNPSEGDITRSMGYTIASAALIYDWCYDVMTDDDKKTFISYAKYTASLMEIGYPTTTREIFAGHGGEGDALYFQLISGIAFYDEDPEMYNLVAGMIFENMIETRKMFMATGNHPAGASYGPVRVAWEQLFQIVYDRMGYENVITDELDKTPMRWIHDRLPQGTWHEDGDSFVSWNKNYGPSYSLNAYPMMLYGSYYGNEYLKGEYIRSLSTKSYDAGVSLYDNGVLTLLLFDPSGEFKYPDDEGNELPLTHVTSYPLTSVFMRTSWKEGINSDTAVVFMNGQEKLVGDHDHEHSDIGNFQIYYKGTLAGHGGTYSGVNGGWGAEHNYNYYRRTISKNCLTVYKPGEEFYASFKKDSFSNDGGQHIEKNTTTLEEFNSHPDEAKTEGLWVGPNKETPEFTYLKTDITNAYSGKLADYTRSMVAMNLFNTDYPLAFVCYDNVTSADKNYKKTWNLQTMNEPKTTGNTTVTSRDDYGYSGKLVIKTLLPESGNVTYKNVGGEGFESYVDGVNYHNPDIGDTENEQCQWRLEISPKTAKANDLFLNAMYVTDSEKSLPELEMIKEDMSNFTGVTVMDRTVLFSKTKEVMGSFTIDVRDNGYEKMSVLITDVAEGKWKISGGGTEIICISSSGENAIYAKLAPGKYSVSPAEDGEETVFDYPRDSRVLRVGDFHIYNKTTKRFDGSVLPTKLVNNQPHISEKDFEREGVKIEKSGNSLTLTKGKNTTQITVGSLNCTQNGSYVTLTSAPFIDEGGNVYINPLNHGDLLGYKYSYDSIAKILKAEVKSTPEVFKDKLNVEKVIEPVSFYASSNDGNAPENVFDFNMKTRWSADGESEYMVIDYGEVYEIDKLMMAFLEGTLRQTKFEILVSEDGVNYTQAFSGMSSGTTDDLESFNVNSKARFIKLMCHGNTLNKWNSIIEIVTIKK
ncbi:MAG: hypothetical protein E7394_07400 [Ruminococcaceae bacterium]|nr:hypothetical protein [Oscillospiraceae bacterium]